MHPPSVNEQGSSVQIILTIFSNTTNIRDKITSNKDALTRPPKYYFGSAEAQETTVKIHIITFSLTKQFKIFANLCCYRNQTFQVEKKIKMETSKNHKPKKATESD